MRLQYQGKETYKDWANSIWKLGYKTPITDIPDLIGVSLSWVKMVLLKKINYVVYDNKWIYSKTTKTCLTYIRLEDLSKYIMENGIYLVQTEIIDLSHVLSPYKSVYNKALKLYKEALNSYKNRGFVAGTIPMSVLDYINQELIITNASHNWSYKERTKIKWTEIEAFDILANKNNIYYANDREHNNISLETIYRKAFVNGDIKIKLGAITIFYKRNQNLKDYKLPYLIPYGQTIKAYK